MSDKSQGTGASGDQDKDKGLSNADVKAHPLFQKLTQELADERKASKTVMKRLEALEAADNERKTKALEAEKDYESAAQKRADKAVADAKKEWEATASADAAKAEAKLQLVKAGFKNERFLKGALADFDFENQTAEEFAKAIAEDDSNKQFLESASKAQKKPDPYPTHQSGAHIMTPAEIEAARNSGKPEEIARANDAAEALWVANQGSTGLPT